MNNNLLLALEIFSGALFLFWLYKCVVVVEEGWHKNVKTWGRYSFTISGVRGVVADENGNLIPGENKRTWYFIIYGIQVVSRYQFYWVEARKSGDLASSDPNVVWGDVVKDGEVSYQRHEWTTRHKDQHNYRFRVNNLETGEKVKKVAPPSTTTQPKQKVETPDHTPENIKIDSSIVCTTKMRNPSHAEFTSDADWYLSLQAILFGSLGEVVSSMTYADLPTIRGEKLSEVLVKNTEPMVLPPAVTGQPASTFRFVTKKGKRMEKITFLERINYEMLDVQKLGVEVINATMLDYNTSEDSAPYMEALQKKIISEVKLLTTGNEAKALGKMLDVKKKFVTDIVSANKKAQIDIRNTEDVTVVRKAVQLQGLRFLVEAPTGATTPTPAPIDINQIVNTTLALEAAEEVKAADISDRKPKKGGDK